MQNQEENKRLVAQKALSFLTNNITLGVGTGSTVNYFIKDLKKKISQDKIKINHLVASSKQTQNLLEKEGFKVSNLNQVGLVDLYVDGADEINQNMQMIKGGGAALLFEKILASSAQKFICIADKSKYVELLGKFALPIEVIPMARSYVAKEIIKIGGKVKLREAVLTDSNNQILDITNLDFRDPRELESYLNNIAGVVDNGIFAKRCADVLLLPNKEIIKN